MVQPPRREPWRARKGGSRREVETVVLSSSTKAPVGRNQWATTEIGELGLRGEPNIKWACVETKEAAEIMRDVRQGPSPIFGMQGEDTVAPDEE